MLLGFYWALKISRPFGQRYIEEARNKLLIKLSVINLIKREIFSEFKIYGYLRFTGEIKYIDGNKLLLLYHPPSEEIYLSKDLV